MRCQPKRATEAVRVSHLTPVKGWSELLLALPEFTLTDVHVGDDNEFVVETVLLRDVQPYVR